MLNKIDYTGTYTYGGYFGNYLKSMKNGGKTKVPQMQEGDTLDYDDQTSSGMFSGDQPDSMPDMSSTGISQPDMNTNTSKPLKMIGSAAPSQMTPTGGMPKTAGSRTADAVTAGLGESMSGLAAIKNAEGTSGQLKTNAMANSAVNGVAAGLSALGPWGMVAGAALKVINGVGGSLMNHNKTATMAKNFTVNQDVANSASYGGVTVGAADAKGNGDAYRAGGLFGKLFASPAALQNEMNRSNIMQTKTANVLSAGKQSIQAGLNSRDMIASRNQSDLYNTRMWNNGSVQYGKEGAKLQLLFDKYKKQDGGKVNYIASASPIVVNKISDLNEPDKLGGANYTKTNDPDVYMGKYGVPIHRSEFAKAQVDPNNGMNFPTFEAFADYFGGWQKNPRTLQLPGNTPVANDPTTGTGPISPFQSRGPSSGDYPQIGRNLSRNPTPATIHSNTYRPGGYKEGGNIHIKPSHEGRFTAYKKRTEQTTEEALHSKDPHVRKMANFARNAAKWKHQQGGTIAGNINTGYYKTADAPANTWFNAQDPSFSPQVQLDKNLKSAGMSWWGNPTMSKGPSAGGFLGLFKKPIAERTSVTWGNPTGGTAAGGYTMGSYTQAANYQMGGKLGVPNPGPRIPRATMGTAPRPMDVQPQQVVQKIENKGDQKIDDNMQNAITMNDKDPNAQQAPSPAGTPFPIGADVMNMISSAISAPNSSNAPVDPSALPAMQEGGSFTTTGIPGTISYKTLTGTLGAPTYKVPSKKKKETTMYKSGGVMNVIVDGHLHAHRHNMEDNPEFEDADITHKGVPVVTKDDGGEIVQHAEVERDELILHYDLTKQLEELSKNDDSGESAVEAGKLLALEIVKNTKDSKSKVLKNS